MTTATDFQIGKVFRLFLCAALLVCGFSLTADAATFVVTSTADQNVGSLRNAIYDANHNPGPDIITFSIFPKTNLHTIVLYSLLPQITETLTIDGWTEGSPGYNGAPLIELQRKEVLLHAVGLNFGPLASNSLVRGLIINRFDLPPGPVGTGTGILISADHVTVQGCYIGTTADGNSALPNSIGITITGQSCLIGGPEPQDRNVISGNSFRGVETAEGSSDTTIEGNYIGVSASGLMPVGNGYGLVVGSPDNTIGGTTAGKRNVISGNSEGGVFISYTGNRIQGNYIGVAPDGVTAMGTQPYGIDVLLDGANNIIGGGSAKAGNVISNNNIGIKLNGEGGNRIQNNLIGVGSDRTTPLGNQSDGIRIILGQLNIIGGKSRHIRRKQPFSTPAGNVIANNGRSGIRIEQKSKNNHITLNSIYNNLGLGIDLLPGTGEQPMIEGVTDNDVCDLDTGANNLQNFPIVNTVVLSSKSGGSITIGGTLSARGGKFFGNATYRLEFFSNSVCSSFGNGEGKTFLGEAIVSIAAGLCQADFTATFKGTLPPGAVITATATDPVNNTSEFSPCAFAGGPR
jgi:hypothetical protein